MSYQVLARKWRPRRFAELVGQEHVVRALTHALATGRVHHAFLFTGTRGVGKTTIARIFAKSLNCERGVSADPCGDCGTCRDIDAGRYLDLLEIDAASNTGVDDVREVIENAQYRPVRGGFKVYLIDEVHMLSKNAFNALLKTLEEPPEHAKFLLATTDPQKLPVTVLSRCLQFNLKRLSEAQIAGQLERILAAEAVDSDADAIAEVARGGNGSMRDALSLLDQAIAFGGGRLVGAEVRTMLGTVDRSRVGGLLEAVADDDAAALFQRIEEVAGFAPDFATVLDELAAQLHRIQLLQFLGEAAPEATPAARALAARLAPEEVQLLYQIAIVGRRDLNLAPNPRAGFEMALLRMLAFRPQGESGAGGDTAPGRGRAAAATGGALRAGNASAAPPAATPPLPTPTRGSSPAPVVREPGPAIRDVAATVRETAPVAVRPEAAPAVVARPASPRAHAHALDPARWAELLSGAGLRGPVRELAHNVVPLELAEGRLRLGLAPQFEHLRSDGMLRTLTEALAPALGADLRITVEPLAGGGDTLADHLRREQQQRQGRAESAIAADPTVQSLVAMFDARVVPNSTRPVQPE